LSIEKLLHFISRIQECIYSELPDLVLSCKIEPFRRQSSYQKVYRKYYEDFLASFPKGKAEVSTFKDTVRYLLFEEDLVL
jgi:hypothetical protein